jgi:hypothetical protein
MGKHAFPLSVLCISLLAAGCDGFLDLEPDDPPEDAAPVEPQPDAGPDYPPLPAPEVFPDEPVVTTPELSPEYPPDDVPEGVEIVFPPPASITPEPRVTMRGTARLEAGVVAVRVNGVDARLSAPGEGSVSWQVDLQPALGRNELVVSTTDGAGNVTAEAARAHLELAPYMLIQPSGLVLDVGHDRLLVSDPGARGIVAIDLDTGAPGRLELDLRPDLPAVPYAMSIDPAAGLGVALYHYVACDGDDGTRIQSMVELDLQDGSFEIKEREDSSASCFGATDAPAIRDVAVVLKGSIAVLLHQECNQSSQKCTVDVRSYLLATGPSFSPPVTLCAHEYCEGLDLIAHPRDPAVTRVLSLVRTRGEPVSEYEVHEIDTVERTNTRIATVSSQGTFFPHQLVFDGKRDRIFVLGSESAGKIAVVAIDLASNEQTWFRSEEHLGVLQPIADAVYDPRRNRLIFSLPDKGLFAMDVDSGAFTRLLRPEIGDGPTLACRELCEVSDVDDTRQRILINQPVGTGSNIYALDLRTGNRSVLSERGNSAELGYDLSLFADYPEDRVIVLKGNGEVYTVDGTSGDRFLLGQSPLTSSDIPMAWDAERHRIVYLSPLTRHELRAYDVDTGEDRLLSSDDVGTGPSLAGLPFQEAGAQIVNLNASGDRAIVSQLGGQSLISVDLVTGNRTATAVHPLGPIERDAQTLVDTTRRQLLVRGAPAHEIKAIDFFNGVVSWFVDLEPARTTLSSTRLIPDRARDRALIVDELRGVQMLDLQTRQRVHLLHLDP